MGWFGSSSKQSDEPNAPDRSDRKKCWETRDLYFSCLDRAGVLIPREEGKNCASELKAYQQNCVKSWVEYFNTRRVLNERQKASLALAEKQAKASS